MEEKNKKISKKLLTKQSDCGNLNKLSRESLTVNAGNTAPAGGRVHGMDLLYLYLDK